jgi:hypothetical protein
MAVKKEKESRASAREEMTWTTDREDLIEKIRVMKLAKLKRVVNTHLGKTKLKGLSDLANTTMRGVLEGTIPEEALDD